MKKKKPPAPQPVSPVQTQALGISEQQRQQQGHQVEAAHAGVGQANQTVQQAKGALTETNPILSRFTQAGPSGMTAFRQALTNQTSNAVANTHDNLLARSREKAQAAGFGGYQPVNLGAETAIENERAGKIAAIPGQVEQLASPLEMEAVQQQATMQNQRGGLLNALAGSQLQGANTELSGAHAYNPESYFGEGANMESQRIEQQLREEELARQRRGGLFKGLAKVGLTAAAPFTGGYTGKLAGAF